MISALLSAVDLASIGTWIRSNFGLFDRVALIAAVVAMMLDKEVSAFLSFVCGNVVGFYFSRTNHAAIGGIGVKPNEEYKGR